MIKSNSTSIAMIQCSYIANPRLEIFLRTSVTLNTPKENAMISSHRYNACL